MLWFCVVSRYLKSFARISSREFTPFDVSMHVCMYVDLELPQSRAEQTSTLQPVAYLHLVNQQIYCLLGDSQNCKVCNMSVAVLLGSLL